ncbi:MAG TPA: sugar phosphate nucleotidyltransferase, partial [Gemmatimonadaceae bacterium]|nr:sugar phosphate nucleotidyltransferase [Gemmatimonadaceae bacterium]
MATLTGGGAKELLPIGGVPLVLRVMEECAASGIDEVLIVSAPGKSDLDNAVRAAAGSAGMPKVVEVVIQEEPRGLADAIRLGRGFAHGSPLAVALADNLFIGENPGLSQLCDVYHRTGKSVVAIVKLTAANKDRYGPTAIYPGHPQDSEFIIERVPDKGPRDKHFDLRGAATAFTGVGRYVFQPGVFATIDEVEAKLRSGEELDDIPVMQLLHQRRRLTGCLVRGDFLD